MKGDYLDWGADLFVDLYLLTNSIKTRREN